MTKFSICPDETLLKNKCLFKSFERHFGIKLWLAVTPETSHRRNIFKKKDVKKIAVIQ